MSPAEKWMVLFIFSAVGAVNLSSTLLRKTTSAIEKWISDILHTLFWSGIVPFIAVVHVLFWEGRKDGGERLVPSDLLREKHIGLAGDTHFFGIGCNNCLTDEFRMGENVMGTSCGRVFHLTSFTNWLRYMQGVSRCPYCHSLLKPDKGWMFFMSQYVIELFMRDS